MSILEDKSGNLWFGTNGGGVNKYDGETFTHFTTKEGLSHNTAIGLVEDNRGKIWIGTYGKGVCVLHDGGRVMGGEKEDTAKYAYKWTYINTSNGLADDGVVSLVFDAEGYVWAGTNKGISRINTETFEVRSYTKLEGFSGIECNQNASYLDSKGNLWFGTEGVTKFNPKADWQNKLEPQTYIKAIRLFFEDVEWRIDTTDTNRGADKLAGVEFTGVTKWSHLPENLVLPYDKNHLTFEYVGISLKIPEKVRYQFMLEGLDKDWSPVTKKTEATYSNIPPGEYTFMVKASNDEGVWNDNSVNITINITPPWWQTWLFRISAIIALISAVITYIRIRERGLKARQRLLKKTVAERTKELREEKEKVEEINIELEKLSIVASKTDNAVIIANAKGEIEWVNEALTRMTGYTLDEYKKEKGNTMQEISANPEIEDLIKECIKKRQSAVYEVLNTTKEGKDFWTQTTLTPILDEAGKLRRLVAVDTDITELKRAEEEIRKSKEEIEEQNKDVLASIRYASLIQQAILPKVTEMQEHLPEIFVLYKPKDIVSGDFYWFAMQGKRSIIAACDCTGHGVPGAFVSMVGNDLLNQIVIERQVDNPSEILKKLHDGVVYALGQKAEHTTSSGTVQDGMDMALCSIDMDKKEILFSGAIRPMWLITKNGSNHPAEFKRTTKGDYELVQIRGDRFGIGGVQVKLEPTFTTHKIKVEKGDTIYMSSDGYPDQFGGIKNKKYSRKRLLDFLLSIQDLSMEEQKEKLDQEVENWRGEYEQTDDITVIGIRI